jgi:prepilin-type N-terminal cleavage/methylation domain-containing protein
MTDHRPTTTTKATIAAAARRAGRGGFTLTELLVVIGVIVLMIAMAVPLFNVFRGSHSIEGAQNMVSAMLQRARARAIAMQERRGVFVFEDQSTKKMAMLLVRIDEPGGGVVANANVLELDDNDEEMQLLPQGVGAAFALGANPGSLGSTQTQTTYRPYGLIAFDGMGRIMTLENFTTEANDAARYPADPTTGKPAGPTKLKFKFGAYIYPANAVSGGPFIGRPVSGSVPQEFSHASVLLFDKDVFNEQFPPDPAADWRKLSTGANSQSSWLDQNATAVVVNRYNGTLMKGRGE